MVELVALRAASIWELEIHLVNHLALICLDLLKNTRRLHEILHLLQLLQLKKRRMSCIESIIDKQTAGLQLSLKNK